MHLNNQYKYIPLCSKCIGVIRMCGMYENCVNCNKELIRPQMKFCSSECQKASWRKHIKQQREANKKWKYIQEKCIEKKCLYCNRYFYIEKIRADKVNYCSTQCYHRQPKTKECVIAWNVKKHFNLSLNEYKRKTRECEICGFYHIVDLHHINGKTDNEHLIALCPNHHHMIHRKRMTIEQLKEQYENDRIRQGQHQGSES